MSYIYKLAPLPHFEEAANGKSAERQKHGEKGRKFPPEEMQEKSLFPIFTRNC